MRRTLLFCSTILGFSATALAAPNNPPSFVVGHSYTMSVCQNSSATSIDGILAVNDADAGQAETWAITNPPVNGTVGGFFTTGTSTGSTITPSGLTYTPTSGFAGLDSFTVEIFDGFDTATTTIFVNTIALPTLSSSLNPDTICNGTVFNYAPTSDLGTTFNWTRLFTAAISDTLTSGTDNPMEILHNTSYYTVPVTYTYTLTSVYGCVNMQNVVVNVNPSVTLSSDATDTICSGGTFHYVPTGSIPGITYMYTRAHVAGITPDTSAGIDTINEMLVNSTLAPKTVSYVYVLTANKCSNTDTVMVTVNPEPAISAITTSAPATLCSGTNYQVFGASAPASAGTTYTWSATNAVISAVGNSGQYSVVSFPNPGTATITLTAKIGGSGCIGSESVNVTVSSSKAPNAQVVYFNQQFVYLDNNIDTYQWGYDDAGTLASTVLTGQVFQSYPLSNPDLNNRLYWVVTTKDGCTQKTYFNAPMAVKSLYAEASVAVTPNPATNTISIEMTGTLNGATEVSVVNMLGQVVRTQTTTAHNISFDIAELPAGCYIVNCSQNGLKAATNRFIKN